MAAEAVAYKFWTALHMQSASGGKPSFFFDANSLIFDANPDIEIVIKSDRSVPFEKVAQALASIQSVGVQNVGIVTTGYDS